MELVVMSHKGFWRGCGQLVPSPWVIFCAPRFLSFKRGRLGREA